MYKKSINHKIRVAANLNRRAKDYWVNKLAGDIIKTTFPNDNNGGPAGDAGNEQVKMETFPFHMKGELVSQLLKISSGSDPRLHMVLVAALVVLLYKYSGNKDIIVGSPVYKPDQKGDYINTVLALRVKLEKHMTFKQLLLNVRETIIEADEHQDYPIEELLRQLKMEASRDDFPLFDVMVLLENVHGRDYIRHVGHNITFSFSRADRVIDGVIEYNASRFHRGQVEKIGCYYLHLLANALANPGSAIPGIEMLPEEEKKQLLFQFNDTDAHYFPAHHIHEFFEKQAEKNPGNTAVFGFTGQAGGEQPQQPGYRLTYRELNEQANQLARFLRRCGVSTGSVVAVILEPSVQVVKYLMAILKTGAAYLPLEPQLPKERIRLMLADSGTKVILSAGKFLEKIPLTELRAVQSDPASQVVITKPRRPIESVDGFPQPDRSFIDLKKYKNKIGMASMVDCISLQATRGCPYKCLFCHKVWSKHHVYRSAENLYDEIRYYYQNGVTNFSFIDDCFNLNRENSLRFFDLIIKRKLDINLFFPNGLRGDIMTPDYIDRMVEAGCRGINLSLETASPRLQKLIQKNLDIEKFRDNIHYIANNHPGVILEIATMHGFPTETQEEAMMTLNFIKEIKWLHFPYIHILKIYPNTGIEKLALENEISKEDILKSKDLAYHELPETLPFPKSFTRQYQADFMNNYFLSKNRLRKVLPIQMNIMSEKAIIDKYNAYLPVDITTIDDILRFIGCEDLERPKKECEKQGSITTIFDREPPSRKIIPGANRILLLDLSQNFSGHDTRMLYNVSEQPLGLMYLLSYLKQQFGERIDGRIYKSGIDFNSYEELKKLVDDYQPELVGIRTLTFYREFFHQTVSLLRQWGVAVPIISGGPYATSDYLSILEDNNVDLVVLGEGEYTLAQLVETMLANNFKLPGQEVLGQIRGIAFAGDGASNRQSRTVVLTDLSPGAWITEKTSNLLLNASPGNLAYVMYTSGSTGKPKGVMVEHRQVNNCISWMQEKFCLDSTAVIAQRTNLTFDPSLWEIFWPLRIGAAVKVLTAEQRKDVRFLIRLMAEDNELTMMYCPSTLVEAITRLLDTKEVQPILKLPWLIIGAEPIGRETIDRFYTFYEGKIVNTYGPTEGTINNTYCDLGPGDKHPLVPIGKPIANNRIYILSKAMQLMPLHTSGEICIAGDSVARGYINNMEKTQEVFVYNPFEPGILYKTGDIGRWRADGNIEILGRLDQQVKIRGHRIEPGEIETVLSGYPAIKQSIVTTIDGNRHQKQNNIKVCKRCGIGTNYPAVTINEDGNCEICEHLSQYKSILRRYFKSPHHLEKRIKEKNKAKQGKYDCILLYSGGRGSAYALYRLVAMGFNVLTITYDNGYFGKKDLENIKRITSSLGVQNIVLTHKNSNKILNESIKTAHTVCRGCFHTSSSLAAEYAWKNDINVVIGATLSRGQIIENKLFMFIKQGITDIPQLEQEVANLRIAAVTFDEKIFNYINIDVMKNPALGKEIEFIDFYRYCDITNKDMINYLNGKDPFWKTRRNHAVYSTNCPIKQVGDYAHLEKQQYHYYGSATAWEKRWGHIKLEDVKEDLQCKVTRKGYRNFLTRLGYPIEPGQMQNRYEARLCAYLVSDETIDVSRLREYVSGKLPEHMRPVFYVQLENIPLTPNGKVDKMSLPAPEVSKGENHVAPRNEVERMLAEIWSEELDVNERTIGIDSSFFQLGGHSLKVTVMLAKVHKAFNVNIPLVEVFKTPTIRALSAFIKNRADDRYTSINAVEKKTYYAISSAQRRLYVLQQLEPDCTAYNIPAAVQLEGSLDKARMEESFNRLIRRHESLRTSFVMIDQDPIQEIQENVELEIRYCSIPNNEGHILASSHPVHTPGEFIRQLIRPFELTRAPLLRVGVLTVGPGKYILFLDMHHIISDGNSIGIFVKEFMTLYSGQRLKELPLQYKDYCQWQGSPGQQDALKAYRDYWLNTFADFPILELPLDYPRPAEQSFNGRHINFQIGGEETLKLKSLALAEDATLFMVLLAAYNVLLAKLSGQQDIIIGSPVAGRRHADLQDIIGMFVNTLALRNFPFAALTFKEFLKDVRNKTLEAFENQDYLYENLIDQLNLTRDLSRNPLFDVMFMLQNFNIPGIELPQLKVKPYEVNNLTSKFDLTLQATETGEILEFTLEYCIRLFREDTIKRFIGYFKKITAYIVENPKMKISEMEIVTAEEKRTLLWDFNDTDAQYPDTKLVSELFTVQAEKLADKIAAVYNHWHITYEELNEKTNQLARALRTIGTGPDNLVGVLADRSLEMVIAIFGIFKAGSAYLPIDPNYPRHRIKYILEDSSTKILVGQRRYVHRFSDNMHILDLEDTQRSTVDWSKGDGQNPENVNNSQHLAYLIYTSGSSGKPKGVMINHGSVVNLIWGLFNRYALQSSDVYLLKTSYLFDVSVSELFGWFLGGGQLAILERDGEKELGTLLNTIERCRVTHINFVPSMFTAFVGALNVGNVGKISSLKYLFLAGEALPAEPVKTFREINSKTAVENIYGPTEATVYASWFSAGDWSGTGPVPIGKPLANVKLYIPDRNDRPQPIGIPGELCIGGKGVARGYLNNPELTRDKITENPLLKGQRLYRTGDLARWLPDGNIAFLGRIDHQVKVRGFRIELGEIENHLKKHPGIKESIVTVDQDSRGDKYLIAYMVSDQTLEPSELKKYLAHQLPDYMIPTYFIPLKQIPLTTSGKLDRLALPRYERTNKGEYIQPRDETEKKLVEIWADVLGLPEKRIGVNENIFQLGGNSIKIMRINSQIDTHFQLDISYKIFFQLSSIAELAVYISRHRQEGRNIEVATAAPDPKNLYQPFPLTDVQLAYLMGRSAAIEMGGTSTHIYHEITDQIDIPRLNESLNKVIRRHPMLRAVILENGQQQILEGVTGYQLGCEDLKHLEPSQQKTRLAKERERMAHYTFIPHQWPLFEIKAFLLTDTISHLCIGFDPLIADAYSIWLIYKEIGQFYRDPGLELPDLELSFRDYMLAYRQLKNTDKYRQAKEYWLRKLENFPSPPALPLKCNPSEIKAPHFNALKNTFKKETWKKLKQGAVKHNITPSVLLCTVYAEVMACWSNQARLALNLTIFNRYPFHKEVDNIVGDFTSLILLAVDLETRQSFWEKAQALQDTLFEGLENRCYDGIEFIRQISKQRNLVNKAVMPIVFTSALFDTDNQQESGEEEEENQPNPDLYAEAKQDTQSIGQTSQLFIDCVVTEADGDLYVDWNYVEGLFEDYIISGMFAAFVQRLNRLAEGEDDHMFYLSSRDKALLRQYNQTGCNIEASTLHELFLRQVGKFPDNTALVWRQQVLTYRTLDEQSNQVARYLKEKGVGSNHLIGVSAVRSIGTIVNIMGVLKTGAAYVPIDPGYPRERRNYIHNNSSCRLLLEHDLYDSENLSRYSVAPPGNTANPDDLAYVIYTSGSTGQPKGVAVTHGTAVNTIIDINRKFSVDTTDKILGISSMCFDLSVYDVFGALSTGAALVIINDQRDMDHLMESVWKYGITVWNSVPAVMDILVTHMQNDPAADAQPGGKIEPGEGIYYWSPAVYWYKSGNTILIEDHPCPAVAADIFPDLYFLTQKGATVNRMLGEFPGVEPESLTAFILQLIHHRVLVNSIMTPTELYASQQKLFRKNYGKEIEFNPLEYEKFKEKQLSRSYFNDGNKKIKLENNDGIPSFIKERQSYREFDMESKIPFRQFSKLLSVLRQFKSDGKTRYYYASAGGLYPIDIYMYVKKGRVENIAGGLYYYNPIDHALSLLDDNVVFTDAFHYPGNRSIFNSSALSFFLVYNAEVTMPKYGGLGYFMAGIDTGIIVGTITHLCELMDLGLCSIGNMDFQEIRPYFNLNKTQVFMHAIEIGLKPKTLKQAPIDLALKIERPGIPSNGFLHNDRREREKMTHQVNRSLRLVLLSGDWIPLPLPRKIKRYFPKTEVISLGGATEASIWSIYYPVGEPGEHWKSIPYGYPLGNQMFYILNDQGEVCPIGVPGELYIGGAGIAQGYINHQEKTESAFLTHCKLGKIYKTGDYGVFHPEGYIEFLGRKDHQVKIRGYRVELGEIETGLMKHEAIINAVVVDRTDSSGKKYLCAYMVADKKCPVSEIRAFLTDMLPGYMIPSYFIYLESIPLTSNGKVDRKSLPEPDSRANLNTGGQYTAPKTDTEKAVSQICMELFKRQKVSVHENFFDIGATSLDVLEMTRKMKERYDVNVPILKIYEYSTIRSLAKYLSKEKSARAFFKSGTAKETKRETAGRTQVINQAKNRMKKRIQTRQSN
ncbi:MAG: amino acid adenylation domain-containing protein [Candidatus Aminicenantes bacterium]|jgi:amino acid adenylation domain-containing protein